MVFWRHPAFFWLFAAVILVGGCEWIEEEKESKEPSGCFEGTTRCDGRWVEECTSDRWERTEQCDSTCESGACADEPPADMCEAGLRKCVNDTAYLCDGDPLMWVPFQECLDGCDEGYCLEDSGPLCSASQRVCQDNAVWQCNIDGDSWVLYEECESMCEAGECVGQAQVHLRGVITYEARFPEASGEEIHIGAPVAVPLGLATVLVSDGTQFIGMTTTQADGSFDVGLSQQLQGNEVLMFVPALTVGEKIVLALAKPPHGGDPATLASDLWVWTLPVEGKTDFGTLLIDEENGSGAAYIYDFNRAAMQSVMGTNLLPQLEMIQPLAVLWAPGVAWSCGACYSNQPQVFGDQELPNTIFISDESGGSSAWGYAVLLHEFGHYVARNYSRDDSPGGPHTIGVPVVPPFAWSEGWATFFALSTFSRFVGEPAPLYWDIQNGGSFWIDVARLQYSSGTKVTAPNPDGSMLQDLDENWVAMMLWDLWDGADVAELIEEDGTNLGTSAVIDAVTSARFKVGDRGAKGADFVDFLDAVLCASPELMGSVMGTVNGYLGFPYDGAKTCM